MAFTTMRGALMRAQDLGSIFIAFFALCIVLHHYHLAQACMQLQQQQ